MTLYASKLWHSFLIRSPTLNTLDDYLTANSSKVAAKANQNKKEALTQANREVRSGGRDDSDMAACRSRVLKLQCGLEQDVACYITLRYVLMFSLKSLKHTS